MSVMLELYLEELKQQLKLLPARQREAELCEIESHLHAMIEAQQAEGMLYGDAVNTALKQFGCPNRVGRELSRSWQEHHLEHPLRALAAALGAAACQAAFLQLYNWIVPIIADFLFSGSPSSAYMSSVEVFITVIRYSILLTPIASGVVAHAIAPRRGWWAALTAYLSGIGLVFLMACSTTTQPVSLLELWPLLMLLPGVQFGSWWGKRRLQRGHTKHYLQPLHRVRNFEQITVEVAHINREHWPGSTRASHWALLNGHCAPLQVRDDFWEWHICEKAQISGAGSWSLRMRQNLLAALVQVDLLRSKHEGFATFTKRHNFHTQHLRIEIAGCFNVGHGEHEMVKAAKVHGSS